MGVSTDGILAYGFDLGGSDGTWAVREVNAWGELTVDWFPLDGDATPNTNTNTDADTDGEDEDEEQGFEEAATTRLLTAAGVIGPGKPALGYFERREALAERVGVSFQTYCCNDCTSYVLATHSITVDRGAVEPVDMARLAAWPAERGWDARLNDAIGMLGLTPVQLRPEWLLVSRKG